MVRVLLVIDDYNEMLYLQGFMRKLGIDVETTQNTKKAPDIALGFNPKILLATAKGRTVNGIELCSRMSRPRGLPKVCLIDTKESPISQEDIDSTDLDRVIRGPINLQKLIDVIADLGEIEAEPLREKFSKLQKVGQFPVETNDVVSVTDLPQEDSEQEDSPREILIGESPIKSGGSGAAGEWVDPYAELRKKRFEEALKSIQNKEIKSFPRARIDEFMTKNREIALPEDADEIEAERLDFIKALFSRFKI